MEKTRKDPRDEREQLLKRGFRKIGPGGKCCILLSSFPFFSLFLICILAGNLVMVVIGPICLDILDYTTVTNSTSFCDPVPVAGWIAVTVVASVLWVSCCCCTIGICYYYLCNEKALEEMAEKLVENYGVDVYMDPDDIHIEETDTLEQMSEKLHRKLERMKREIDPDDPIGSKILEGESEGIFDLSSLELQRTMNLLQKTGKLPALTSLAHEKYLKKLLRQRYPEMSENWLQTMERSQPKIISFYSNTLPWGKREAMIFGDVVYCFEELPDDLKLLEFPDEEVILWLSCHDEQVKKIFTLLDPGRMMDDLDNFSSIHNSVSCIIAVVLNSCFSEATKRELTFGIPVITFSTEAFVTDIEAFLGSVKLFATLFHLHEHLRLLLTPRFRQCQEKMVQEMQKENGFQQIHTDIARSGDKIRSPAAITDDIPREKHKLLFTCPSYILASRPATYQDVPTQVVIADGKVGCYEELIKKHNIAYSFFTTPETDPIQVFCLQLMSGVMPKGTIT